MPGVAWLVEQAFAASPADADQLQEFQQKQF
jgi:hypothetical protein